MSDTPQNPPDATGSTPNAEDLPLPHQAALDRVRVVLINTTHPGNIGATARAMKVMGLSQLHLVTPHCYPSAEATALASGADDLLQHAGLHESLDEALAGCRLVIGTSARLRSLAIPQMDTRAAAHQAIAEAGEGEVAILFGRERYGLTNEEMQRCHYLLHIPANPDYSSLNLSQAVQVISYELRMAAGAAVMNLVPQPDYQPVGAEDMERLFEHLQETLTEIGFLNPDQPKKLMGRLRRLFQRARPDANELNILRGILSAAQGARRGAQDEH